MLSIRIPSRTGRALAAAAACGALLGLGCGQNRVVLNVDVLSFMDSTDTVQPYDVISALPFSVRLPAIPINLVEGYQDFGTAQEATLDIGLRYDNQTGRGQGRLVLYFSDDVNTLYATPQVATIDVDLAPATVSNGSIRLQLDQRMLDLFTSKHFWMGVELAWSPVSVEPLAGTCSLAQIDVQLVSQLDLF